MARTRRTTHKSTDRLPVGQLAPRNVPQPQESQPDVPQEASPEEEPFEIELVIPESPTAQDSPAEEQQQPGDHDTEDKTNEEHPPPSDTESEKMYRDADEVESFRAEAPVLAGRLRALLEHLGITIAPRYRIKEVPHSGRVEVKAIAEIFFGSRVLCRHKGPAFRTSRSDAIADAAWQAITSWVHSNKKDQFKAYGGEKGYPQDGDGTPPGFGGGAEHSSADRSAQDRDSSHSAVKSRRHHLRLHEDGRGSGQRPLCIRHRHLDSHLLGPEFKQGARSEQPLPLWIP
jgi:hypothetical protein